MFLALKTHKIINLPDITEIFLTVCKASKQQTKFLSHGLIKFCDSLWDVSVIFISS